MKPGPKATPFALRFWPKVNLLAPDGHWIWMAGKTHDGYGFLGDRGGQVYVHRYTYETLVGPVPAGLQLDHLCRVRHCCNPSHLEPVTNLVNARRGMKAQQTHCKRGHEFTPENTVRSAKTGRRTCRTCRNESRRIQKVLPNCARCGIKIHRVGSGWRHALNQATGGQSCGLSPLLAADEQKASA